MSLPATTLAANLDPTIGRRVIFIVTDSPDAGDQIADLVSDLGPQGFSAASTRSS